MQQVATCFICTTPHPIPIPIPSPSPSPSPNPSQVASSFVCSLHYAYATPDALCLVLEWLRGGSLQYHLKRRRAQVERRQRAVPFDEREVRGIPSRSPNPNPSPNPSPNP